jgi:hypothetical protein
MIEPVRASGVMGRCLTFFRKEMEKLSDAEAAKLAEVRTMLEARGLPIVGRKVGAGALVGKAFSPTAPAGGIDRAAA